MPTPITVSANLIDLTGNAIQGYMTAAVVAPTGVYDLYVAGLGLISPKTFTSSIGSSISVAVWGNDVIVDLADNALDTYYTVTIYNTLNQVVWQANYYFTGTGPINLVGFQPIVIIPPPPTFSSPPISQLPGGIGGSVQYNNTGTFGGDSTFTFNAATKAVTSKGIITGRAILNQGTAYSGADSAIVLSGTWGGGAAVSNAAGTDQALTFTVTAGTSPGSYPTLTITFKDGVWPNPPLAMAVQNGGIGSGNIAHISVSTSITTATLTWLGTPTVGATYSITLFMWGI